MANYIVTDTELTSVANAIRAKTGGNASLSWPTGFTTDIGNITSAVCDGYGVNSQLVATLYNEHIKLADTNWNNLDLTSTLSNSTVYTLPTLANVSIDTSQYDYRVEEIVYIKYNYKNNTQIIGGGLELFRLTNKIPYLATYRRDFTPYTNISNALSIYSYNDANGTIVYDNSIYGLNISNNYTITSSSLSYSTFRITVTSNTTKFTNEMLAAIDADNTYIDIIVKIYSYDKNSTLATVQNNELLQFYNSKHPELQS